GVQPAFQPDRDGTYKLRLRVASGALSGQAEVAITAAPAGHAGPNADAGPDRNAITGSKVVLDGRRSYDPDQGPASLSFAWTFREVPPGNIHEGETLRGSTLPFVPDLDGVYEVLLTVSDG